MNNRDRLNRCVIRIELSNSQFQSGWFFTKSGHILTAGHGFRKAGSTVGQQFQITRASAIYENPNKPLTQSATLIEFEPGGGKSLDYALLKLDTPQVTPYIPLYADDCRKSFGEKFDCGGFASELENEWLIFSGEIRDSADQNRISVRSEQLPANGISGAPIVLASGGRSGYVIGIQSQQARTYKQMCWCSRIDTIVQHSPQVRQILGAFHMEEAIEKWQPEHFGTGQKKARIRFNHPPRYVLIIHSDVDENRRSLEAYLPEFRSELLLLSNEFARDFSDNSPPHVPNIAPVLEVRYRDETAPVEEFLDGIGIEQRPFLRLICDLTGDLNLQNPVAIEGTSHVAGIRLTDTADEEIAVFPISGGDLRLGFTLKSNDPEKNARRILTLLGDILLDIAIFHHCGSLSTSVCNFETSRDFSRAKVQFARSRQLEMYGHQIPDNGTDYLAFGSCCRKDIDSKIDIQNLRKIWRDFLLPYVQIGTKFHCRPVIPLLKKTELLSTLRDLAHYGGQISQVEISKQWDNLVDNPGTPCAFLMIISKPLELKDRTDLIHALGFDVFRVGLCRILPLNKALPLGRWDKHLLCFQFKRAMNN